MKISWRDSEILFPVPRRCYLTQGRIQAFPWLCDQIKEEKDIGDESIHYCGLLYFKSWENSHKEKAHARKSH
jgi:hypothetical protein